MANLTKLEDDVQSIVSSFKTLGDGDDVSSCGDLASLILVGSIPYRDFRISIFKKPGKDLFYYEPLVALDTKNIQIEDYRDINWKHEISFKIELWNIDLEQKITKYLEEFEGLKRFRLQVMPYEEVRLVKIDAIRGRVALELPDKPKSYRHLHQSLWFKMTFEGLSYYSVVRLSEVECVLANQVALEFSTAAPDQTIDRGFGIGMGRVSRFDFNFVR